MPQHDDLQSHTPLLGSLTGFSKTEIPTGNPNLVKTGWSVDQIQAFLLNLSDVNFPTEEWTRELSDAIALHLADFDNPHKVTLDQIMGDLTRDVLSLLTAGTVPQIAPFFAWTSHYALPLGDMFPAHYSSQNFYRMTESGIFTDPSVEIVTVGSDWSTNHCGVPLFSLIQDTVIPNWATNNNTAINTTITDISHVSVNYPFDFYSVVETNASGSFGLRISNTQIASAGYTATFLVQPTSADGSIIVSQANNTSDTMTINLADGSYTLSSTNVMGHTVVYPSGFIRVSFGFIASNPVTTGIQILHRNDNDTTTVRQGTSGRALFTIAHPSIAVTSLNHPLLINPLQSGSTTPLTLDLTRVNAPVSMSNLMINLVLDLYPSLNQSPVLDTTILTFDALTITRDTNLLYVNVNGIVVFTSSILAGLNNITLSYSPNCLIFKDLATLRQVVVGTYPALSTAHVSLGPCSGYLNSLAFYAQADTQNCVEYLTNG